MQQQSGQSTPSSNVATKAKTPTQLVLTYANNSWHARQRTTSPQVSGTGPGLRFAMPGYQSTPFISSALATSSLNIFELNPQMEADEVAGAYQYIAVISLGNSTPKIVEIKDFGSLCQFVNEVTGQSIMALAQQSHATQQRGGPAGGLSGSGKVT